MSRYILRRVISMIPVLLIVSIIAFGLLYVLPGDPAVAILGDNAGNQQTYLALRHDLGLDQPLYAQYLSWLGRVVQGRHADGGGGVGQDRLDELGEMGANLLLELMANQTSAELAGEQVLPVELLIRESCGGGVRQ